MAGVCLKSTLGYLVFICHIGFALLGAPMPKYDEQKCDSLSLDDCFKNLQVFLQLSSLPFTSESKELDKLCEKCLAGYNCSTVFIENRDCLSAQNKELLPIFVSMAQFSYLMLCGDEESTSKAYLRSDYLEYSGCINRHASELKCCAQATQVPDLPVLRILEETSTSLPERRTSTCCPLSRFIQCASNVAGKCGDGAANLTAHYIRRAAGEQVQVVCQELPNFPNPDAETCHAPVPTCSGCFGFSLLNNFLIVSLTVLIWIMY